jgi:hypothetical protein
MISRRDWKMPIQGLNPEVHVLRTTRKLERLQHNLKAEHSAEHCLLARVHASDALGEGSQYCSNNSGNN